MAKTIHDRVRARIAAQDAAREKPAKVAANRRFGALQAAETRRERRYEALRNGDAEPRTLQEMAIAEDDPSLLDEVLPPEWEEFFSASDRKAAEKRAADRVDGFDRDDLGESPDY